MGREAKANKLGTPDPPMKPMAGTVLWFETGPQPIRRDLKTAALIVRVGLASNALQSQFLAVKHARSTMRGALRMMNVLATLSATIGYMNEAIDVARQGMKQLRQLARAKNVPTRVLIEMGQLCAGKHPASGLINTGRNRIAFHWDEGLVESTLEAFGKK